MAKRRRGIPAAEKVRADNIPKPLGSVALLSFSFRYLHQPTAPKTKFSLEKCANNYLPKFLGRLKEACKLTLRDLQLSKPRDTLRSHPIAWHETTEPNGFEDIDPELWEGSEWQISITSNKHGRLHGFVIGSIFHVVWIDPDHELFPRK